MSYKDVYTNMIEKCYTIYQQTQMLIKIIEKVGENEDTLTNLVNDTVNNVNQIVNELNTRVDNIDQTLLNLKYDKNNEIYNFLKSIKINGHILNANETFDVDTNGNVKCENATVNSVIYPDGSIGETAKPKMYIHRIEIYGKGFSYSGETTYIHYITYLFSSKSTVYTKNEIIGLLNIKNDIQQFINGTLSSGSGPSTVSVSARPVIAYIDSANRISFCTVNLPTYSTTSNTYRKTLDDTISFSDFVSEL